MSDLFSLKINLTLLSARLSSSAARSLRPDGIEKWLAENGFSRDGDHWVADSNNVGLLEQSEVLAIWPADEPDGAAQIEYPASEETASPYTLPPYALTDDRRKYLASIPGAELCLVPRFLVGRPRDVVSKWQSVARKIVRHGKIEAGMKGVDLVHVDNVPGHFLISRNIGFSPEGHDFVLYPMMEVLGDLISDAGKNKHEYYIMNRQILMEGLDHFWFCLSFIVLGMLWLPKMPAEYDADRAEVRKVVIGKILKWWPHLCARDDRFASGLGKAPWPQWFGFYNVFDVDDAWPRLSRLSCGELGEYMKEFLRK